ncbi:MULTISPECIES: ABC transporter permease [Romboutsia]|uniref:Permease component of tungstate ABC transporter n=1 Tax=Romboutsia hominis TaxID=1507512 RepID=A0A2P2BSN9_9FIRM|nr:MULTISPECIES: ABC transporter permease [Romboutsia]MCH1960656.1 ABC transporter permease [Romboutsia hominis]MCH1968912.1 ABC transporter permease [Romboutsia hominis]MDB8792081.1 ABC transporter permease [Romboutsia sp. 1001216sp1]MDB8804209.1 ABC transporter permease [Romboutsia sp. 1001216sp1]MDB8808592.1 ABC transporter permease [Romboutsia sp. 1001216sp1]
MEVNDIIQIISLSLIVTTTATMIAMIIAIVLSIVIYLKNFRFKKYIITFVNALMSTPPVIMGLLVFLMLSRQGPLGEFKLLFTPVAMIIAQAMLLIPMAMSLIIDLLNKFGGDILTTCKVLQIEDKNIPKIFLKEIKYHLLTVCITTFSRGISEVGAVMLVGGNIKGSTRVMTTYIALSTSMGDFDESLVIAFILLTISTISTIIIKKLQSVI